MALDKLRQVDYSLEGRINTVLHELTETLHKASSLDDALKGQIKALWEKLAKQVNPDGENQDAQDMAWQLFETILYGDMDMYKNEANSYSPYSCECPSLPVVAERDQGGMRNQIRTWMQAENFAQVTRRRPHLVNIIINNPQLKSNVRLQQIFLLIISEHRKNRRADTTRRLASDAEILALAEEDNIEVYFEIMKEFFTHLSSKVFGESSHEHAKEIAAFFRFMSSRYLPTTHQFSSQLREIRGSHPHIEGLWLKALLGRNGGRIKAPVPEELFKRWEEVLIYLEDFAQCKERGIFSFTDALKKREVEEAETGVQQVVTSGKAAAVVESKPAPVTPAPAKKPSAPAPRPPSEKKTAMGVAAYNPPSRLPKKPVPQATTPAPVQPPSAPAPPVKPESVTQTIAFGVQALNTPKPEPAPVPVKPPSSPPVATPPVQPARTESVTQTMAFGVQALAPPPAANVTAAPVQPPAVDEAKALRPPASSIEALASGTAQPQNIGTTPTIVEDMTLAPTLEQGLPQTADAVRALFTHQFDSNDGRRHGLNELYKFLRQAKSEGGKRTLMSAMVETLMENLHADPSFPQTSSLCEAVGIKKPKAKDVTPSAFLSPYGELDESDLDDAPEELAGRFKQLLEVSKHLSLIHTNFGASIHMIDVPAMDDTEFQMMCHSIFNQLKRIREEIYGKWKNPGTWGRPFKYKKIRKFYDKLHKAITAQLAINEQLIFTKGSVS
ncbi:hypothetical protein ACFL3C_04925 [Patescibacteria group bacterium]